MEFSRGVGSICRGPRNSVTLSIIRRHVMGMRTILARPGPSRSDPRRHRLPARRSSAELTRDFLSVAPDVTDERTLALNGQVSRLTPSGTTRRPLPRQEKPTWRDHIRFIRLKLHWTDAP